MRGVNALLTRVVRHYFVDSDFPIWADPTDRRIIDHLCRVTNCYEPTHLRVVTYRVNTTVGRVSMLKTVKSSQSAGVYWHQGHGLWHVSVRVASRRVFLGQYEDEQDASTAYQQALTDIEDMNLAI